MEFKLYEIYYNNIEDPTWLDLLTYYIYKLNDTKLFKNKLCNLIYKLEYKKFGKCNEKLIETQKVNFSLKAYNSNNHAINFYRTKAFETWKLKLENGYKLYAADEHLLYVSSNSKIEWKYINKLTTNDYVLTDEGWSKVKEVYNTHQLQYMADITVKEDDHSYFSNGILSHNTTSTAAFFTWYLCFHTDRNAFVCANKGKTATDIMGKIKEVLAGLPYFLKPGIVNLSETRIKFENGCSVKCAAASKTPATGDSLHLLYVDEMALIAPGIIEEYWASVIPTMSNLANSQIIVSSTPRGKTGKFYEIVNGAMCGKNNYFFRRVDWWQVPGHDEAWAEKERRKLCNDELFEREFNLSFDTDSSRLLSNKAMALQDKIKTEFVNHEFFNVPTEISKNIIWHPNFNPETLTYNDLLNRRFLLVIDTAQGIEAGAEGKKDSDYNVINIFEIEPMSAIQIEKNRNNNPLSTKDVIQYKQIGLYMDNFKNEEQCAEVAKAITFQIFKSGYQNIDNVRILVEMNFNGNNWLNKFKTHPNYYAAVIIKTQHGQNAEPGKQPKLMFGFKTTGGKHGKTYYCELGGDMMHKRQIIISQYNKDNVNLSSVSQIQQFCKNKKNSYEGMCCHDDISVTCVFVSIAQESTSFIAWINDWLETCIQTYKIQKIREMLRIYVERETQIDAEASAAFYKAAGRYFNNITYEQHGYSSLLNTFSNQPKYVNGYNQGFGNILPTRYINR